MLVRRIYMQHLIVINFPRTVVVMLLGLSVVASKLPVFERDFFIDDPRINLPHKSEQLMKLSTLHPFQRLNIS